VILAGSTRTGAAWGSVPLTLEEFTYGFVNTFSPEDAKPAYENYAVRDGPDFYEAGFANFHLHPPTEVHFKKDERAPLREEIAAAIERWVTGMLEPSGVGARGASA
jgi:hypothetical protein